MTNNQRAIAAAGGHSNVQNGAKFGHLNGDAQVVKIGGVNYQNEN